MSVVINELEVVATPESPPRGPGPALPPQPPAPAPTPFEMRALLRHVADRADRARAD
jgi:hypothetical protein